jgi:hypothetical protein
MRLRTLLETGSPGLKLLGGGERLDRRLLGVMTTDLRDPSRYLRGGELVLTGLAWWRGPGDAEPFVRALVAAGVAGLAAGEAEFGSVPEDVALACARHGLPLFAVPEEVSFAEITERVVRQVSGERAGDLTAVVDRHRRLMSAGPAGGGGPQAVLSLLSTDLDLRAWLLTATGQLIAACGTEPLPEGLGAELAVRHLAAARAGHTGPYREVAGGEAVYSLFPVGGATMGPDLARSVPTGWLLAVASDAAEWPAERLELLRGVAELIAAERERREAGRAMRRRLAREVLALAGQGAPPAEIAARLRMAASVLVPHLAEPRWQVVVAQVAWDGDASGGGPAAGALLEELLADAAASPPEPDVAVAVARGDGEAVALVPLPPPARATPSATALRDPASAGTTPNPAPPAAAGGSRDRPEAGDAPDPARPDAPSAVAAARGRVPLSAASLPGPVRDVLAAGLGEGGRLTIGVSAPVSSAEGLRGALEEARHARRAAAARPGRVSAADHEHLASHVLLLPFVPDDVRRAFTARLLDPLRAYDRRHRADLVATLTAFLEADGSWTRCAARLHLHVNTLRYRIGRIERLTGRDPTRLEDQVDFFLALRMS